MGDDHLHASTAIRMVTEDSKISFEKPVADKCLTHSETEDRYLEDLVAAAEHYGPDEAKKGTQGLRHWDRTADADSPAGALFQFWLNEMRKYRDFSAEPFDLKRPVGTTRGFKDAKAAAEALAEATGKLQKLTGRLEVPWGNVYRFRRGKFDLPGDGSSCPVGTCRIVDYKSAKDGHFEGYAADRFIAAVEFEDTFHAKVLTTFGNSSDSASPLLWDQLVLTSKKQLRDALLTRKPVENNLEGSTDFRSDSKIVEMRP